MKRLALLLLLASPGYALAEDDGDELLALMQRPASREAAVVHIDDVRNKWDGTLFCMAKGNPQAAGDAGAAAFAAVKTWLEAHPQERYRSRRYLIIQALRATWPCARP